MRVPGYRSQKNVWDSLELESQGVVGMANPILRAGSSDILSRLSVPSPRPFSKLAYLIFNASEISCKRNTHDELWE